MGWKDLSNWLKGGIWGMVIYFAFQIIAIGLMLPAMLLCYNGWNFKSEDPICAFIELFSDTPFQILKNSPNWSFIIFIIVGIIIGLVVGKIKSKNIEN